MSYELITKRDSKNYGYPTGTKGQNKPEKIVVHWWGTKSSFDDNVGYFCDNPSCPTSAHAVLEAGRVVVIVDYCNSAWHAGNYHVNNHSIGIECNTRCSEGDLRTLAEYIADLWKIYGKLPVIGHKDVVATRCPGSYYPELSAVVAMAEEFYKGNAPAEHKPVKPAPLPPKHPEPSVYDTNRSLTPVEAVMAGQAWSNKILETAITVDGIIGYNTKRNAVRMVQWALNKDYGFKLDVDGLWGPLTQGALGEHYVRYGETQYLATAVEVLLLMNGYNPHGVEVPGTVGTGCAKAIGFYQTDAGLAVDKIAGKNTIMSLATKL